MAGVQWEDVLKTGTSHITDFSIAALTEVKRDNPEPTFELLSRHTKSVHDLCVFVQLAGEDATKSFVHWLIHDAVTAPAVVAGGSELAGRPDRYYRSVAIGVYFCALAVWNSARQYGDTATVLRGFIGAVKRSHILESSSSAGYPHFDSRTGTSDDCRLGTAIVASVVRKRIESLTMASKP